jgi:hypothetical protein
MDDRSKPLETDQGITRGWFLLAAGAIIIVLLTIVLVGTEAPQPPSVAEETATTTAPEHSEDVPDTSTWVTYQSDEYDFALEHPQNWVVAVGSRALDPMVTIYQPPLAEGVEAPLTHFDEATHVSIYPHGIATEGIFGRTSQTAVSVSPELSRGLDHILENDQPWATQLAFSDPPASWGPSGFVWARVRVTDLETLCTRANREIEMSECDPLVMEDKIRRTGTIDEDARRTVETILSTFRFTDPAASMGDT